MSDTASSPIKSFVRLRPLLPLESGDENAWEIDDGNSIIRTEVKGGTDQRSKSRAYAFDWVFPSESSSPEVYEGAARQLIQSTVNGFNSVLLFYGPTGSGKSYSMLDLTRLATRDIFQSIAENPSREFVIGLSAVEIYSEKVMDLISPKALSSDVERSTIKGLRSAEHLLALLSEIEDKRKTAEARARDRKSGSHVLIRIYIESRPLFQEEGDATRSVMSFVDLAGSEVQSSGHINRSLTTFTRVIRDLAQSSRIALVSKGPLALNKTQHIPYRESKLTSILQACLSGNAHMNVICTASPSTQSCKSTRDALLFGCKARDVVMRPMLGKVSECDSSIIKMKSEIEQLQASQPSDEITRKRLSCLMGLILNSNEVKPEDEQGLPDSLDLSPYFSTDKPVASLPSALPPRTSAQPSVRSSAPGTQTSKTSAKTSLGFKSILSSIMPTSFLSRGSRQVNISLGGPSDRLDEEDSDADSNLSDDLREGDSPEKFKGGRSSVPPPVPRLDLGMLNKPQQFGLPQHRFEHPLPTSQSLAHFPLHSVQGDDVKRVEAAMETIKNELRCMKHSALGKAIVSGSLISPPTVDVIQTELKRIEEIRAVVSSRRATRNENIPLAIEEEEEISDQEASPNLVDALRAQLVAILGAQEARARVDNALGALQERFGVSEEEVRGPPHAQGGENDVFLLPPPPTDQSLSCRKSLVKSSWGQGFFGAINRSQHSPLPSKEPSTGDVEAKQSTEQPVRRLTSSFRASAAREVGELKAAIDSLRDKVEMLEMHKRLLLTQYVHLEGESKIEKDGLRMQVAKAIEQRELAKYHRSRVEQSASAMIAHLNQQVAELKRQLSEREGSSRDSSLGSENHALSFKLGEDHIDEEEWGRDSERTLMPRIITLWDKLFVPLVYRSRFYLFLRNKDVFYFDMELRRLEWKQSQIETQRNHTTGRSKEEERTKRALLSEQRDLASQLKWNFTDEQRESLMHEWGVNLGTNKRKLQLVKRLWHPHTLNQLGQEAGAQKCAQVVLSIVGSTDASGQFMELVFGGGSSEARQTPGPARKLLLMMTPRKS